MTKFSKVKKISHLFLLLDSFYLEDNKSKFGTLVLMRNQLTLSDEENNNLAV